jgi:predicted nucleotidyltransferase
MGQDTVLSIIRQFKRALESLNIRVEQVILFGSHATGTAREDSDIDLVVISPSFSGKSYWERIDILTDAIYKVFAPIEASAFTPDEWKSKKSLISDYAQNGVLVNDSI